MKKIKMLAMAFVACLMITMTACQSGVKKLNANLDNAIEEIQNAKTPEEAQRVVDEFYNENKDAIDEDELKKLPKEEQEELVMKIFGFFMSAQAKGAQMPDNLD